MSGRLSLDSTDIKKNKQREQKTHGSDNAVLDNNSISSPNHDDADHVNSVNMQKEAVKRIATDGDATEIPEYLVRNETDDLNGPIMTPLSGHRF